MHAAWYLTLRVLTKKELSPSPTLSLHTFIFLQIYVHTTYVYAPAIHTLKQVQTYLFSMFPLFVNCVLYFYKLFVGGSYSQSLEQHNSASLSIIKFIFERKSHVLSFMSL